MFNSNRMLYRFQISSWFCERILQTHANFGTASLIFQRLSIDKQNSWSRKNNLADDLPVILELREHPPNPDMGKAEQVGLLRFRSNPKAPAPRLRDCHLTNCLGPSQRPASVRTAPNLGNDKIFQCP